jgi:tetrahydromethanopterin S-methyltransferase subunit G
VLSEHELQKDISAINKRLDALEMKIERILVAGKTKPL